MRLNESVVVSAPPKLIWDYVVDPANVLHYMAGVTRWEVCDEKTIGLGARYRVLFRIGAVETGGLVEVVEFDEPRDMAWSSVTGIDQRGRWRPKVEFRLAYGVAGAGIAGWLSEWIAAPTMGSNVRRSLHQLKRQVEHEKLRAEATRRREAAERTAV
jgi:uncharacterized protein YndB with AHSA1/START domain